MVNRGAQAPEHNSSEIVDSASLDTAVATVHHSAASWHALPIRKKVQILDKILVDTMEVSSEWTIAACEHKGMQPDGPEYGEELFAGVGTFVRMVRSFRDSLNDLDRQGRPRYPGPVNTHSNNRISVGVAPATLFDRILYLGMSAEVWMQPGVTEEGVRAGQALAYQAGGSTPAVCLVLGAGNVASLAPRDAINQLFGENHTVIIKANPVNDYLIPFWERAMRALIAPGYLRIVSGDAGAGSYLTNHELIDSIHITGSDKTYEAIVFGTGPEGAKNKAANNPITTKEISAELGCVTPIIILPGKWSAREMRYQARHLATMFTNNDGFNCLTPRVIITHQEWPQREAFMKLFTQQLRELPTRTAYYPGAWNRQARFVESASQFEKIGDESDGKMAWTVLPGVEASDRHNMAFNQEAWCSVIAQTSLSAPNPKAFALAATKFCNEVLWGTLSANIIVDPRSLKTMSAEVEEMLGTLEYGTVGLNAWSAASLALSTPVWGAYPGHQPTDIQSGNGFVGNAYMFSTAQKTILRGRFRPLLTPSWFAGVKNGREVMERFAAFEAAPSWLKIPALLRSALKG
jgi:Aldehyde dehydrogenase family